MEDEEEELPDELDELEEAVWELDEPSAVLELSGTSELSSTFSAAL